MTSGSRRVDNQSFNLTHGNILSKLMGISVPIVGTQLLLMSYNMVDMFLLGRLHPDAVAASGSAGMYMWLAGGVQMIGRMGAEIGVSQYKGKGDAESARQLSHNSLFMAALTGVLLGLAYMVFAEPLMAFLNIQEADVHADARTYLWIIGIGIPASFVSSSVAGTFTGAGNSRAPFFIMALGLLINALLDPLLIFTAGLGVAGAAIATVIAQYCALGLAVAWLLWKRDRPFGTYRFFVLPRWERIRQILVWSIPVCVESLLFTFFSMVLARHVAMFGANAITVFRVGGQSESICWLICLGFSSGITAFVGQNYGARKWSRIRSCVRQSVLALVGWGIPSSVFLFVMGKVIFRLFVPNETIVEMGGDYLKILSLCQVFLCLEAVGGGAFRGLGRTFPPSLAGGITNALRVPLAYLLPYTGLGLNGIWWIITVTATARGLWMFLWLLSYLRTRPSQDGQVGTQPIL